MSGVLPEPLSDKTVVPKMQINTVPKGRLVIIALLCTASLFASAAVPLFSEPSDTGRNKVNLNIGVTANFKPTLLKLEKLLAGDNLQLTLISASTGTLFQQILYGAPFDIFLAADSLRPAALEARGLIFPDTRRTYAFGRLVLWSHHPDIEAKALLTEKSVILALANPRLAPYGKAAKETLRKLGLWASLTDHLVRGRDVSQTFLFVATKQAKAAFISKAQLAHVGTNKQITGSVWQVPPSYHEPIEQQVVILARSQQQAASRQFVRRLLGSDSQELIRQLGYSVITGEDFEQL